MSWFTDEVQRLGTNVENIKRDPIGIIKRGPKGMWAKDEDDDEDDVVAPTLASGEVDPEGELGPLQDIRKQKQGRLAHNLAPASGASILTS